MAKHKPKADYDVGYGKPPKHTRFQPGQSGNPGGRPKGASSFTAELSKAGDQLVRLNFNGMLEQMTMRRAAANSTWLGAIKGNPKLLELISELDVEQPAEGPDGAPEIQVRLVLEEEPPHIRAARLEFEAEYPNFDPERPPEEWGPDDGDGAH